MEGILWRERDVADMGDQDDLPRLPLPGLAYRCREESERFFRRQPHDPRYCYELFRRAILEQDQAAWEKIFEQFSPLVQGWIRRHPAFSESGEEVSYFINRALEKLWAALTPERFHQFNELKSILRYLQLCVHSAIMDHMRLVARARLEEDLPPDAPARFATDNALEEMALDQVRRESFWRDVSARLKDDSERKIVYASYVLALKPREILEHYRGAFTDVRDIYRIKENVIARLRRDPELLGLIAEDA